MTKPAHVSQVHRHLPPTARPLPTHTRSRAMRRAYEGPRRIQHTHRAPYPPPRLRNLNLILGPAAVH